MTQDTDARQKDRKAKGRCARCRQGLPQTIDPVTGARICRLCARGFQREDSAGDGQHDAVGAMRRFLERCVEADAPMLAAAAAARLNPACPQCSARGTSIIRKTAGQWYCKVCPYKFRTTEYANARSKAAEKRKGDGNCF